MRLTREQVEQWADIAAQVLAFLPPVESAVSKGGSVQKIADLAADWLEMDERLRVAEARFKELVDTR